MLSIAIHDSIARVLAWKSCRLALVLILLPLGCTLMNNLDESKVRAGRSERACTDGVDDDDDELIDCRDPDCEEDPACHEDSREACTDGRDNDVDQGTDCGDPGCFFLSRCFVEIPYAQHARCPAVQAELFLDDAFNFLEEDRWTFFYSGERDRASIVDLDGSNRALDLNGRDQNFDAGIASKATFHVGVNVPFRLAVQFRVEDACGGPDLGDRCRFDIDLHTRKTWMEPITGGGESVLGVQLEGTAGPEIEVRCIYHERPIGDVLRISPGTAQALTFATDEEGRLTIDLLDRRLCRTPVLQDLEPETRLVVRTIGYSAAKLLIDAVSLHVEAERTTEACEGRTIGRGVLADPYCTDAFYDLDQRDPEVVRTPDGRHHLLFVGYGTQMNFAFMHAISEDGRRGWRFPGGAETANAFDLVPTPFAFEFLGALIHQQPEDRLLVWASDGTATSLWAAPREPLVDGESYAHFSRIAEGVRLEGEGAAFLPESIVARGDELWAYFSAPIPSDENRSAIFLARSSDGVRFEREPEPVLRAGVRGDWDLEGLSSPSVAWTGQYFVMSYVAKRNFSDPAIGFAVSEDGRSWRKHARNPLFVAEDEGFDDFAISSLSLHAEDLALRIWYAGTGYSGRFCGRSSTYELIRIGLVELDPQP